MGSMLQATFPAELGYDAQLGEDQLGFSLNPIKAAKGAVKFTTKAVKASARAALAPAVLVKDVATGKNVVKSLVKAGKSGLAPLQATILDPLNATLLAPLRNKVNKLKSNRAKTLAWQRRRSKVPNAQEQAEARAWTKTKLKHSGPHGYMLVLFAAPEEMAYAQPIHGPFGEPITIAAITASMPILIAVVNAMLKKAQNSGEASDNPAAAGAQAAVAVAQQALAPYAQQPQATMPASMPDAPAQEVYETPPSAADVVTPEETLQGAIDYAKPAVYVAGGLGLAAVIGGLYLAFRS